MRGWQYASMVAALMIAGPAVAQNPVQLPLNTPMVADVSQNNVEIHASFNGAQLLIFGARNQPGDVVIAVRGPEKNLLVRRKERIVGMWMNVEQQKYDDMPIFYAIASTRPLADIASPETLHQLELGDDAVIKGGNPQSKSLFDAALVNNFARRRVWQIPFAHITYFGESLFKAKLNLPDTLPDGNFTIDTYLFDHGQLVSAQSIPLITYKTGLDARIFTAAQHRSLFYGLSAISMALVGGWLAHQLFNRRK